MFAASMHKLKNLINLKGRKVTGVQDRNFTGIQALIQRFGSADDY
jgi:hypothetical protein